MKSHQLAAVAMLSLAIGGNAFAQEAKQKAAAPAPAGALPLEQRASYVLGLSFGKNLKEQDVAIDTELLLQGIRDALSGANPKLTDAECEATMEEFRTAFVAQQQAKAKAVTEKNKKEGAAYLAANKSKPNVKTTASGLQYLILEPGQGESPKPTDVVRVHYKGTLIDGTEFDSSYARNEPAEFPLNRVIPGWTEGLQLLKPGGKIQLVIPSELGYGENGTPDGEIGPGAVLVFDIELLEIKK